MIICRLLFLFFFFFFQAEDGIRDHCVTGVQTCALPIFKNSYRRSAPVALLQTTDLGITARVGEEEAVIWVTGVQDGIPKSGVDVELRDPTGRTRARGRTNAQGLVRLGGLRDTSATDDDNERGFAGYVS